jgi:hypothetical protein
MTGLVSARRILRLFMGQLQRPAFSERRADEHLIVRMKRSPIASYK